MTSQKQNDPRIVIISGYSGCGKGTVISRLMEKYGNYAFSVSMTTRDPRDNEIDGVHYHFVTNERFEKMIDQAGFLEYAGYTDNYYGTPAAFVHENLAAGRDVLLDIEVQGAMQIREKIPEAILIFVSTPTAAELENRLVSRGTETPARVSKRLKRAVEESTEIWRYDHFVINDTVEEAADMINGIIREGAAAPLPSREFMETFTKELIEINERREMEGK